MVSVAMGAREILERKLKQYIAICCTFYIHAANSVVRLVQPGNLHSRSEGGHEAMMKAAVNQCVAFWRYVAP